MRKKAILITALAGILLIVMAFGFVFWHAHSLINEMVNIRVETNGTLIQYYEEYLTRVEVENEEGLTLNAWQFSRDEPRGIIIMLHGMHGMDASSLLEQGYDFWQEGFEVFSLDMRAHGLSEGEEIGLGYTEVSDVSALLDWVGEQERFEDREVYLFGFSMGGAVAINTAAQRDDVHGVISLASFSSYEENFLYFMRQENIPEIIVSIYRPAIRFSLRQRYGMDPVENSPVNNIARIYPRPVLLFHGDQDDQVPVEQGQKLYDRARENVELHVARGKGHMLIMDILVGEPLREKVFGFLR